MKKIQLTQGYFALVDDEDFEYLNQFKWSVKHNGNTSYAERRLLRNEVGSGRRRLVKMHREIMKPPDNMVIDHINHNGLDNRRENLRIINRRENHWNLIKPNKTGFAGVYKNYHKYTSNIRIGGKKVFLGSFNTAEEAYRAYMECAYKLMNAM